ncbi:hypothetical protein ACOME3_009569 [Neoechinorhynchus agilis]
MHALHHLNKRLIATHRTEEIRGGGLLKYCELLSRDYVPINQKSRFQLERCMCTRFFIDFLSLAHQENSIAAYIETHFELRAHLISRFLSLLHEVISRNAFCLMNQERQSILSRIRQVIQLFLSQTNTQIITPNAVAAALIHQHQQHQQQQQHYPLVVPVNSVPLFHQAQLGTHCPVMPMVVLPLPPTLKLVLNSLAYGNIIPVARRIEVFTHNGNSSNQPAGGAEHIGGDHQQ